MDLSEPKQKSDALSLADKWRVRGFVYRGEAPDDPRMASAAVGLAERYQRGGLTRLMRPLAILVVVLMVPAAIYATVDGRALQAVLYGLMALMCGAHLMFNPATRPENVERSLEASRRVSDSGS